MPNDRLSKVYVEHQKLLEVIEEDEKKASIPDVKEFIMQIAKAGSTIHDPRQRSQLRALMRFWGSYIYDRIGEFPETSLMPVTDINKPSVPDTDSVILLPAPEQPDEEQQEKNTTHSQVPESGSCFGIYEIFGEIGSGGFSTVYNGLDTKTDRLVALKIIHSDEFERTKRFQQHFVEREKLIGELDHPHIVPVYAVGEEQGISYIAMKYVESGSLDDRLSDWFWQPTIREILKIALQVIDGLDYLHSKEIVHRDIKPANILLGFDNNVYLTDFGIAQVVESAFQGMIVGTPEYLAPEAILKPEEVKKSADLYSLGIVLFELLDGKVPFFQGSPVEIMHQQVNEDVPALSEDIPKPLRDVVVSCLDKDPGNRSTVPELRKEVDHLLQSLSEESLESQPAPFVAPPGTRCRSHQTTRIPAAKPSSSSPIPVATEKVICPSCGSSEPKDAAFCNNCGAVITEKRKKIRDMPPSPSPIPGRTEEKIECPNCGFRMPKGSLFCDGCGARISEQQEEIQLMHSQASDADTQVLDDSSHLVAKGVLAILIGERRLAYYVMNYNRITIGRSQHNDIILDHPTVSRQHALLDYDKPEEEEEEEEGTFTLYDLASANGILVNEEPCIKQQLEHNDIIALGKVVLTFKRLDR
jgi:serine/threonine protein kinase